MLSIHILHVAHRLVLLLLSGFHRAPSSYDERFLVASPFVYLVALETCQHNFTICGECYWSKINLRAFPHLFLIKSTLE